MVVFGLCVAVLALLGKLWTVDDESAELRMELARDTVLIEAMRDDNIALRDSLHALRYQIQWATKHCEVFIGDTAGRTR